MFVFLCLCFVFSSSPPYQGGVFAWWRGAGPELDHLYQFVSDYSHQLIVQHQLTHQQTARQDELPRANYFSGRLLISNDFGFTEKIYQPFKGALNAPNFTCEGKSNSWKFSRWECVTRYWTDSISFSLIMFMSRPKSFNPLSILSVRMWELQTFRRKVKIVTVRMSPPSHSRLFNYVYVSTKVSLMHCSSRA